MNAGINAVNATMASTSSLAKPLIGIVLFILVIVGLYYLYNFLYGSNLSYGEVTLLSDVRPTTKTSPVSGAAGKTAVSATSLSGVMDGGQYTASMWVYIADTKSFPVTQLAHLLEISNNRFATEGKGDTLLFLGINPRDGTLIVRQSTADDSYKISNSSTADIGGSSGNFKYPLTDLIGGTNPTLLTKDDRCDILNGIEYQRWVLITIVGNGRTLDVYVDGKLARSCVYKSNFALGSTTGQGTALIGFGNEGALKGYFANSKFYNYALAPDAIWSLYQAGPTGYFNISSFFSNLFNVNVSFGTSAELNA